MTGIADARMSARMLARLAEGPAAVEDLLAAARDAAPAPESAPESGPGREGAWHALVHALVRAGKVEVVGRADSGAAVYGLPGTVVPPSVADGPAVIPPPASPRDSRVALAVASRVRDPEERGRVVSDVLAHLAALAAAGRSKAFGPVPLARDVLARVDRGRATIACPENGWERLVRFVRHEGLSILTTGAVLAFLYLFVAEFRVVPTNSMRPGIAPGDRLLVYKLSRREVPDRFALVVFDDGAGTKLVKRLVALPGEAVAVDEQGDLVVDGKVVVKPPEVAAAVREPLVRSTFDAAGKADGWSADADGWRHYARPLHADEPAYVDENGTLELNGAPRPEAHDVYATAVVTGPARLRVTFLDRNRRATRVVETGAGAPGEPAAPTTLSISLVDGVLRVGDVETRDQFFGGAATVAVHGAVASVAIDRDVHYTQQGQFGIDPGAPFHVPPDHLFFLGDHSAHSQDSRYRSRGPIPLDRVLGRVVFRVWPLGRIGFPR
ncbi:MAG: signal peptidase I [Planctomycetota bacterium]